MMKLVIHTSKRKRKKQRNTIKNTRFKNHQKVSLLVKVLEEFFRSPILVLAYKRKL
jgi:hypothetical protein